MFLTQELETGWIGGIIIWILGELAGLVSSIRGLLSAAEYGPKLPPIFGRLCMQYVYSLKVSVSADISLLFQPLMA